MTEQLTLQWVGPFRFFGEDQVVFDCPESVDSGIYVWTFPHGDGHLVHYVGETGRSFRDRFVEHVQWYLSAYYPIYDLEAFVAGQRDPVWEGIVDPSLPNRVSTLISKHEELAPKIRKFLGQLRVFLAPTSVEARYRRRIEGAIADHLKGQDGLVREMLDIRRYSVRYAEEEPISLVMNWPIRVVGLPDELSC